MDNITEETVMSRVMQLLRAQTVIVIAHRLSSIRKFEHVIVLKNGRLIGQGSFDELMENNTYFRELYLASARS